jgi:hypothetical protein
MIILLDCRGRLRRPLHDITRRRAIEMKITKRAVSFIARLATSLAGILMLASAGLNTSAQQAAPPRATLPIWSGTSAGYTIQWTASDLVARSASGTAVIFSARQMARQDFANIEKDSDGHCDYERSFTLLSVVGPLMSYEDDYFLSCERTAHPDGQSRFIAINLSKPAGSRRTAETPLPGNVAKLTDYFPENEILKGLLADAVIQKALAGKRPRTLGELLKLIGDEFPTVAEDEKLCFTLEPDLLTRFAFHHVEGDFVAVRLGLSGAGVCRDNLTQIGLLLPIPASLKAALAKAEAGGEGFLLSRKIGAGRQTKFTAETKKRPAHQ